MIMKKGNCEDKIINEIEKLFQEGWDLVNTDCKGVEPIANKIEKLSKRHKCEVGTARYMLLQARIYVNNGDYAQATDYAMKSREISRHVEDIDGQIKANHVMGFMCNNQGNLEAALSHYQDGLKIMKDHKKDIDPAFLNNIAVICYDMGKIEEALTLYLEALAIAEKLRNRMQGLILANIAEIFLVKGDPDIALQYNNRALAILQEGQDQDHYLATCYNMFAQIYSYKKQWDIALDNFQKSLQIYQDIGQRYSEALQLLEMGKFYLIQEKYQECTDYLNKAIEIGEATTSEGILKDAYLLFAEVFDKQQKYKEGFASLKRYNEFNEKIKSKELNDKLAQQITEMKIEKAQKDAEIEHLKNVELRRQAEENALKAELLAESYKDIKIIGEIGQKLTATLEFRKVTNLVYKNIHKLMDADFFGICLYNEAEELIEFKLFIEHGKRLPLYHIRIDNEKSLAARCILTKKEIVMNEVDAGSSIIRFNEDELNMQPKSIVYYPLLIEDKVIGAITVQSYKANSYTDKSIEMLKALASYIAIAIYNSQKSEELKAKSRELERLSKTDALTGLFNRRHIMDRIEQECIRYERTLRTFCVVVLDIDHFKNINDAYGHDCGDYTLVNLSNVLKSFMRKQDVLARWGGEEFLILLPETDEVGAMALCERIRQKLASKSFTHKRKKIQLTATFGVAEYDPKLGVDVVINNADKALYEGKNKGRNCVVAG